MRQPARPVSSLRLFARATQPASASPPPDSANPGLTRDDWDLLFRSVKDRLSGLASRPPAAGAAADANCSAAEVLDCVSALDSVYALLTREFGRHSRFELDLAESRMALSLARAELVRTRVAERRERHRAAYDALTRVPNGGYFRAQLEKALLARVGAASPLAVLYLDVDHFKEINDTHGHAVGDALLRIVAIRLSRALRARDVVGRLGGDEFGCLLANLPDKRALGQLAAKLFDAVAEPVAIGSLRLSVQVSIGIAVFPADGGSAERLLHCADAAMYRAKRTHTGHRFYDAGLDG
jgi:diguanylate cyclase